MVLGALLALGVVRYIVGGCRVIWSLLVVIIMAVVGRKSNALI